MLTRLRPCASLIAASVTNSHLGEALCNISCDQRCKTIHSAGKSEENRCKSRCGYQGCICIRIVSESRFGQEKEGAGSSVWITWIEGLGVSVFVGGGCICRVMISKVTKQLASLRTPTSVTKRT